MDEINYRFKTNKGIGKYSCYSIGGTGRRSFQQILKDIEIKELPPNFKNDEDIALWSVHQSTDDDGFVEITWINWLIDTNEGPSLKSAFYDTD